MPRLLPDVVHRGALAGRPQPELETDGGDVLRPWRDEDAPHLFAAYADPAIRHWHHRTMDAAEAATWILDAETSWREERDAEWAVVGEDGPLGRVALRGIALAIGQAEVSYWTTPAARGRGVATRAVTRLATWALHELGMWRLVVRHSVRNVPSCRVATAAGFTAEGVLRRCHLHADGWHDIHVHTRFRDPRA